MTQHSTTPALPVFYGKPIDTPTGHRWAGEHAPIEQTTVGTLAMGDVVVTITGDRRYAAFDVDHNLADGRTSIWTALRDQEAGQPRHLTLESATTIYVIRRAR